MTDINITSLMTHNLQSAKDKSALDRSVAQTQNPSFKDDLAARRAAQDFEAMYLGQVFNQMFSALPTDGYFGGGAAEDIFRSMLVTEYGKGIAQNGGVGIADHVYREMIQMQQQANIGAKQ